MIFISIMTAILVLAAVYVALRLTSKSQLIYEHRHIFWLFLALVTILQMLGPILYRTLPTQTNISFVLQWITYTSMGLFSCLFFYTLITDAVIFLMNLASGGNVNLERRSVLGVGLLTGVTTVVGGYQALRGAQIFKIPVPIKDLPQDLAGFTIAQITDLHIGPTIGKKYVEDVVQQTNKLSADIIAITGDLLDGHVAQLYPAVEPLKNLKAKYGVYFVTGNHEYYWKYREWQKVFDELGFKTLTNEHEIVGEYSKPLVVAGVPDEQVESILGGKCDVKQAFDGCPENSVKVLLAHRPNVFNEARLMNVDLQLSGHTHAGQYFPWSIMVAAFYKYWRGLNLHDGKTWVYVSRGTGYWGPPLRFTVPAEISLLELKQG